jgi:hypothetical protein
VVITQAGGLPMHAYPPGQEVAEHTHWVPFRHTGVCAFAVQPAVAVQNTHAPFPLLAAVSQTGVDVVPEQSALAEHPHTLLAVQAGLVGSVQSPAFTQATQTPGGGVVLQNGVALVPPSGSAQSGSPVQPRHAPWPPAPAGSHTWLGPHPSTGVRLQILQAFEVLSHTRFGSTGQSTSERQPTHVPSPLLPAVLQTGEPEEHPGSNAPASES